MSFVSTAFLVFYVVVLFSYHLLARHHRIQNLLILAASWFFYAWFDWRFLSLLIGSIAVAYAAARLMEDRAKYRTLWLLISIFANLAVLFIFKYLNFFIDSLIGLAAALHFQLHIGTTSIILPIGISFYTFQSISYTIDVYRRINRAERDPVALSAYISFFPQLIAGPIERAGHLLPQFRCPRSVTPEQIDVGIWLVLWGFFLKIVVGDTVAPFVDTAFTTDQHYGWSVLLGTIAFGLQIYGDFCGYSCIAKGLAALLGFDLVWNFRQPYWSTSIRDFWQRWHISLSQWIRDYVYIPLGGNRRGTTRTYFNLMVTMFLFGLWHGAAWNFVFWGLFHGMVLVMSRLYDSVRPHDRRRSKALGWLVTTATVFFGWFLFRAQSEQMIFGMLGALDNLAWKSLHWQMLQTLIVVGTPVALVEWLQVRREDNCFPVRWGTLGRSAANAALLLILFCMSDEARIQFIYFRF